MGSSMGLGGLGMPYNTTSNTTTSSTSTSKVPRPQGKLTCFTPEAFAAHLLPPGHPLAAEITAVDALRLLGAREALERADAWQLGVSLFMLLSGTEPVSAQSPRRQMDLVDFFRLVARHSCLPMSSTHTNTNTSTSYGTNTAGHSSLQSQSQSSHNNTATQQQQRRPTPSLLVPTQTQNPSATQTQTQPTLRQVVQQSRQRSARLLGGVAEVSQEAWALLETLLHSDPRRRPDMDALLCHPFLTRPLVHQTFLTAATAGAAAAAGGGGVAGDVGATTGVTSGVTGGVVGVSQPQPVRGLLAQQQSMAMAAMDMDEDPTATATANAHDSVNDSVNASAFDVSVSAVASTSTANASAMNVDS